MCYVYSGYDSGFGIIFLELRLWCCMNPSWSRMYAFSVLNWCNSVYSSYHSMNLLYAMHPGDQFLEWNFSERLDVQPSERLASLGIMRLEGQLGGSIKLLEHHGCMVSKGLTGPMKLSPIMPKGVVLSDSGCTFLASGWIAKFRMNEKRLLVLTTMRYLDCPLTASMICMHRYISVPF